MRSVMCRRRCFTEPGWNAHEPSEIGIDDFQSNRSLDETYRTSFLRGLFAHMKRGFYQTDALRLWRAPPNCLIPWATNIRPAKTPSLSVDVVNQVTNHYAMELTVRLVSRLLKKYLT